jgi:hypothetical protein
MNGTTKGTKDTKRGPRKEERKMDELETEAPARRAVGGCRRTLYAARRSIAKLIVTGDTPAAGGIFVNRKRLHAGDLA